MLYIITYKYKTEKWFYKTNEVYFWIIYNIIWLWRAKNGLLNFISIYLRSSEVYLNTCVNWRRGMRKNNNYKFQFNFEYLLRKWVAFGLSLNNYFQNNYYRKTTLFYTEINWNTEFSIPLLKNKSTSSP